MSDSCSSSVNDNNIYWLCIAKGHQVGVPNHFCWMNEVNHLLFTFALSENTCANTFRELKQFAPVSKWHMEDLNLLLQVQCSAGYRQLPTNLTHSINGSIPRRQGRVKAYWLHINVLLTVSMCLLMYSLNYNQTWKGNLKSVFKDKTSLVPQASGITNRTQTRFFHHIGREGKFWCESYDLHLELGGPF